jgi:hypothetical protein
MKTKFFLFTIIIAVSCNNLGQKQINYVLNEQKINDSINKIELKNVVGYNLIEETYLKSPETSANYRTVAFELKQRSDEIFNYMQGLKIQMITISDGPKSPAINGEEINIARVSHLKSISIPKDFMLGANEDGNAYALKYILNEYKSFLSVIVKDDPIIMNKINNVIDLSNHKSTKSDEADITWVNYNFKEKSLGEVLNILSNLQFDVKSLESDILSSLNRNALTATQRDSI